MKSERGITIATLMVYVVAMAMVIITVTNITRYFYANVTYTEDTTEYAKDYLAFLQCITEEINKTNNTVFICDEDEDENGEYQRYIIFSKTHNQYTFMQSENAIYKNQTKICENVTECSFGQSENGTKLAISLTLKDGKEYSTTYTVRNY